MLGVSVVHNPVMTDSVLLLCRVPTEPLIWVWSGDKERSIGRAMYKWREARLTVRTVRGSKMQTEPQLFDEFAAALQFPTYFGENWSALDDCLTDMDWLPPEAGYVLVVTEPLRVLEGAPEALPIFVRRLASACAEWSTPIALGEWWDRPGVAFHTVLVTTPEEDGQVRQRWKTAGAPLSDLPL